MNVLNRRTLSRSLWLGLGLAVAFLLVGGGLWVLFANVLGLGTVIAFFLAACLAPVAVAGPLLLWLLALPPERRQSLLGATAGRASATDETPDS